MRYGVTPTGFVIKPLSVIQEETSAAFREKFGDGINLDPESPLGVIKGILDERQSLIWQLMEAVYNSQYPHTSEGINLDNVVAITGNARKPATRSRVDSGRARGDIDTTVPAGTIISVDGNPSARFVTLEDAEIDIPATNSIQVITASGTPDGGDITFFFQGDETAPLAYDDVAGDLKTILEALPGIDEVTVTGSWPAFTVEFTDTSGEQPQPLIQVGTNALTLSSVPVDVEIEETQAGDNNKSDLISLLAESAGNVQAPANTLTVIETPVVGLDAFTNEQNGDVGANEETDTALKIRREQELAISGSGTLNAIRSRVLALDEVDVCVAFENNTDVIDGEGRPPHSVDVIVQGGTEQDIAEALYAVVSAGVGYFGSVSVFVNDSQGFAHEVKFSRPVEVPIYLILDLTVNSAYPLGGDAAVVDAILEYAETLTIGEDVVIFGTKALVAALSEIPGIDDVAVRVGAADIPADGDATVTASNDGGEIDFTASTHGLVDGNQVTFTNSGGALPTNINEDVVYWVVDAEVNTFKVSLTRGGDPIAYSSGGTGTHTVHYGGLSENIVIGLRELAVFASARIEVNS